MQLLTATAGVLLSQFEDPLHDIGRRLGLAHVSGPATAILQAAHTTFLVASNPAADRIGTEPEVPYREPDFTTALLIPLHY